MSLTLKQLAEEAMRLSPESRADLAEQLVASLEPADGEDFHRIWSAEAVRRRDEVRSGRVQPVSGEEVLEEARRIVGR
jgi:putative addiction module component (TIGR02574 family)